MAEGILGFYDVAKQREFARDFQFRVVSLGPLTTQDLVYLRTADLPGKENSNNPVPYMGLDFNVPGAVKYTGSDSWPVTFLADEAQNIRSKLEAWMTEVFDVETSSGKYGVPAEEATIDLLDKEFKTIRRYNLVGVTCRNLSPLGYDIKGAGAPQEFSADFSYHFWRQSTSA
jgi:hypothetical protein